MKDPFDYLEKQEAAITNRLCELVRVPTVNPPGALYQEMAGSLSDWCELLGMIVDLHRVPDETVQAHGVDSAYPRLNLIARWDVGAEKTVHFNAHYDVVPAAGQWRHGGPFEPALHGDWLYGRGVGDMKGSITALLSAIDALRVCGETPAFNIECSFTADEETGGALGAGWIVQQGLVKADFAVVCEGAAGSRIGCGHNGVLWLEVHVEGKAAHASNPDQGKNAFEGMTELVYHLQGLKRTLGSPSRRYRADHQYRRRFRRQRAEGQHSSGRRHVYDRQAHPAK
jgi:succinyl-diaminopimelate desuccinylase